MPKPLANLQTMQKMCAKLQQELLHDSIAHLFAPCLPMFSCQKVYLVFIYDSIPNTISFVSLNINYSINFNANLCVTWNTDLHIL